MREWCKDHVYKHTASRGSGGMLPGNNCILDSLRLLLVHSQVPENGHAEVISGYYCF